jgi:hypothetical protein
LQDMEACGSSALSREPVFMVEGTREVIPKAFSYGQRCFVHPCDVCTNGARIQLLRTYGGRIENEVGPLGHCYVAVHSFMEKRRHYIEWHSE